MNEEYRVRQFPCVTVDTQYASVFSIGQNRMAFYPFTLCVCVSEREGEGEGEGEGGEGEGAGSC